MGKLLPPNMHSMRGYTVGQAVNFPPMPPKSVSSLSQTVISSPAKSCKLGVAAESQDRKIDSSNSSTWSLKWEGQGPRLPLAVL